MTFLGWGFNLHNGVITKQGLLERHPLALQPRKCKQFQFNVQGRLSGYSRSSVHENPLEESEKEKMMKWCRSHDSC